MKKSLKVFMMAAVLLCTVIGVSACGTPLPLGCLYTQVMLPGTVGSGEMKFNRMGESTCWSILGWFAGGNASINQATENGKITKVSWTSQEVVNILGIYGSYTTVVYGMGDTADPTIAPATTMK